MSIGEVLAMLVLLMILLNIAHEAELLTNMIRYMRRCKKKRKTKLGIKTRIRQCFCEHEARWMRKNDMFFNLRGETHYLVCKKCGKILDERFMEYDYDGKGFK